MREATVLVQTRLKNVSFMIVVLLLIARWDIAVAQEITTWSDVKVETMRETTQLVRLGEEIYKKACFYCHGEAGEGDGSGERYLFTKPRDFTSGQFKIRSTATGSIPTDEDLFRTITTGFPEFRMPRFEYLTPRERWALVYYIKRFASVFDTQEPEYPSAIGPSPPLTNGLLALGEEFYEAAECWKCHGREGHGDGPSAPDLMDDWGHHSRVAAFALGPRAFKRGSSLQDIVQTFLTGLAGTPMPSYDGVFTNEQAWAVAYYVVSLAEKGETTR